MEIQAFGYLGLGSSNLDDWAAFATSTIGMQSVDRASSMRAFRMDDRKQRLFIDRAIEPGTQIFGWEVPNAAALDLLAARLEAASISAAVTRKPPALSSSRSNFRVASISAASPRAATSSTMERVAVSISADTSRFMVRKLANRSVKSALLRSRRTGMAAFRAGSFVRTPTAQWRGDKSPSTLARRSLAGQASEPDDWAASPTSLVPRSSVPRSVSSHSRHSTSSRSALPRLNSSSALPPGASAG
jgi:hypothetical protein